MRSEKKNRLPEGDDGRTIANMNVDGMPWYSPGTETGTAPESADRPRGGRKEKEFILTKDETRYYTWGALKGALAVAGVMCVGIILFVLFCQYVWFR